MREIKFRAYDKQTKAMRQVMRMHLDIDGAIHVLLMGYTFFLEQEEVELMQYTGLKDKNGTGVEVYESDIGKIGEYICKLIWDEVNAQFRWIDLDTGQWIQGRPSDAEVIGNIYENPELLEAK